MNKPLDRFCVDRRIGIIAVCDTKHPEYEPDRPGCSSPDFPWVIASWEGYITSNFYLYDWQISKANYLCEILNCYEILRLITDKPV